MTKKDYQRFVRTIGRLHRVLLPMMGQKQHDKVMEAITAQIALTFAEDNASFNSFQFAASCEKERREAK